MRFQFHWARHAAGQSRSPVRELLRVAARPGLISFAGGLPAPDCLPTRELRSIADSVISDPATGALQYGETEGCPELREAVARRYSTAHLPLTRENVLITTGSQQGLDLIGRALLDPEDLVLVENPTYLAALGAWRLCGARFLGMESDGEGMRAEALAAGLKRKPRLVYTIPNYQNPQGVTLAGERRPRLASMAAAAGAVVVEDDPYGELWFEAPPPGSIQQLSSENAADGLQGNVLRLGTASKIAAPGLRVGWVIGPANVVERLATLKQSADLHTGTLDQRLLLRLLQDGVIDARLPTLRQTYARRRDLMLEAMDRFLRGRAACATPKGGFFLWVKLPAQVDAGALLPEALTRGVAFVPGRAFHLAGGTNTLRLSFSQAAEPQIAQGVARLAGALEVALASGCVDLRPSRPELFTTDSREPERR